MKIGKGEDNHQLNPKALKELMHVTSPVIDSAVLEGALRVELKPKLGWQEQHSNHRQGMNGLECSRH